MLKDLRLGVRMLFHTKGWTAVVLLSLALGIGANTALFSAINGVIISSVPVPHAGDLVRLRTAGKNEMRNNSSDYGTSRNTPAGEEVRSTISYPIYQAIRAGNQTLTDILACAPTGNANVVVNGKAELASLLMASGNYFTVLEVPPASGRLLTPDDDQPSAPAVAVISYGFWVRRFGQDPSVIGQAFNMNGKPVTIVGITPAWFTGIQGHGNTGRDITVPLSMDQQFGGGTRMSVATSWWLQTMGRLKPGVTLAQVRGNLEPIFQNAARDGWNTYFASITPEQQQLARNRNRTAVPRLEVDSGSQGVYDLDSNTMSSAQILSVVVILVLVIVCANVANLLLSRATSRRKEISVRLSMGATRGRLVRQLLTESVLLSGLGGLLGLLVGYWSRQLLPFGQDTPFDWRVFGFVAALSLLTGMAFGLLPAFRATRVDVSAAMKENSRSVIKSRTVLSKALLVLQVSVSIVVLIAAGLFLRTLMNLRGVDVGFNTQNVALFSISPQLNGYEGPRIATLLTGLRDSLRAVPGVQSVSFSGSALLAGSSSTTGMFIQGQPPAGPNGLDLWVMSVSPEFFDTFRIPLVSGRGIEARDLAQGAARVAVVNETVARKYFAGQNPLGHRFGTSLETTGDVEIVGVIRDTKYSSVRDAPPPTAYNPFSMTNNRGATFEVRTATDAAAMMPSLREAVRKVDPNLPLSRVSTQAEQVEGRFSQERLFASSYAMFGALALVLASIGLFGLMSYTVARRTNEIGIRMALGAQRPAVLLMVLGESLILVLIGVGIGVACGIALGIKVPVMVSKLLFNVPPIDPIAIAVAVATMVTVSLIAGFLPAWRASRVDPMIALRDE